MPKAQGLYKPGESSKSASHPYRIAAAIDHIEDNDGVVYISDDDASESVPVYLKKAFIDEDARLAREIAAEERRRLANSPEVYDLTDGLDAYDVVTLNRPPHAMPLIDLTNSSDYEDEIHILPAIRPEQETTAGLPVTRRISPELEPTSATPGAIVQVAIGEYTKMNDMPLGLEDEELARKLAAEEEIQYAQLVKEVEEKEDGMVFKVVVNAADGTLEDGTPAHPDDIERFEPWRKLFEPCGMKITKFHWFVNYELEKRFEQAKSLLEILEGKPQQELQLFHGTAAPNIDLILKGGFKIGGQDGHAQSHGAASGFGIYLAVSAATSMSYAFGANKLFACRVVPGRITNKMMRHPCNSEIGEEPYETYSGPGLYVVRHAALVLPCYMIEFEADPNRLTMPGVIMTSIPGAPLPITVPAPIAYTIVPPKRPAPRRKPRMILHPEHPAAQRKSAKGKAKANGKGKGKAKAQSPASSSSDDDD